MQWNKILPLNYHLSKYSLDISTLPQNLSLPVSKRFWRFSLTIRVWSQSRSRLLFLLCRPQTSFVRSNILSRHRSSRLILLLLRAIGFHHETVQYNLLNKKHTNLHRQSAMYVQTDRFLPD